MKCISLLFILLATACTGSGTKDSDAPQVISSPLEAQDALEMKSCNDQKKFYDPVAKICELKINLASWSCDRGNLAQQTGMNFYQEELAQVDDYTGKQQYFFFECGQSDDRTVVILAKSSPRTLKRFDFYFDGSKRSGDVTAKHFGDARIDALTYVGDASCSAFKSGSEVSHYEKRTLKFSQTKSFELTITRFKKDDAKCTGAQQELLFFSGSYSLGSTITENIRAVTFETKHAVSTMWNQTSINEANAVGRCNKSNWQGSVAQDIISAPSCTWNANLQSKWYQIISIKDASLLQLGLLDASHLGATEETRPVELDPAFIYKGK